jgi:hypothetical protein
VNNVVCGQVPTLSPFVLATRASIPGGMGRYECSNEWAVGPLTPYGKKGKLLARVECSDGSSCDLGTTAGECTFSVAVCPNQTDDRVPRCTPTAIASYLLKKPLTTSADPVDVANAFALLNGLAPLGPSVFGLLDDSVQYLVPPTSSACTSPIAIRVPLKNGKKGSRVLKVEAMRPDGKKDADALTLVCRP